MIKKLFVPNEPKENGVAMSLATVAMLSGPQKSPSEYKPKSSIAIESANQNKFSIKDEGPLTFAGDD